ncbi:MAG TPA: hypothetical protein VG797_01130 [Phycisphaerales bacterium]|nr:hypothetical protein [Phycisphaerales bacterium]
MPMKPSTLPARTPIEVAVPTVRVAPKATVDEVLQAFRVVRADVANLFALSGIDPIKTRESARELNLNRGVTWRLTRIVREPDAALVVSEVPGRQGIAKFFQACRERGAPEKAIESATASFEAFEAAVSACSGDRKTLAMLMANRRERTSPFEQERERRKLFEGASSFWGVQAQVRFVTVFLFPSPDDPKMLDAGHSTGYIGFRRLGARAWPLSYEAVVKPTGERRQFVKEPLQPDGADEGQLQLLHDFCSPSHPKIDVVQMTDMKRFELAPGPLGNEGLTTCVFGSRLRRLYERTPSELGHAAFNVLLQTPVERVVFDMFAHRDLGFESPAITMLLDRLTYLGSYVQSEFERQALPVNEEPAMLPPGPGGVLCPHIPWYPRLLSYICDRIGQPQDAFTGSRFEMAYPPISTMLHRRFDLQPRGS